MDLELEELRDRVMDGAMSLADTRRYLELLLFSPKTRPRDAVDLARGLGLFDAGKGAAARASLQKAGERKLSDLLALVDGDEEGER